MGIPFIGGLESTEERSYSRVVGGIDRVEDCLGDTTVTFHSGKQLCKGSDACLYPDALTVALSGNDTDGYNFAIGGNNAKDHFADFKAKFNARSGGRDMFQGKVQTTKAELEQHFSNIKSIDRM